MKEKNSFRGARLADAKKAYFEKMSSLESLKTEEDYQRASKILIDAPDPKFIHLTLADSPRTDQYPEVVKLRLTLKDDQAWKALKAYINPLATV